ncbi:NUDIX hydrolase [Rhizobium sp. KVB221]|uniref:NUDIX hydrolase n=1 Tax=Rhizobium setariae TaxID=2801340 RepID=A0A936YW62_9HYPH|nr:NUDIX hydrolase [Rhizobium setariae]MBL0374370.1 NUDIX hydrolase [Rhizobium setariae]
MTELTPLEAAGFPPEGVIFEPGAIRLAVLDGEHPWHCSRRTEVAENWAREIDANPHLYDGQMVFQRQLSFSNGALEGRAHMIPFSAFLHWRKQRQGPDAYHLFGLPVVMSSDGALIAIRMGAHTANPGRVYCAAGSMDRHDVVDGLCDLDGNMRREVLEETGLDLAAAVAGAGYHALHALNTVCVFRVFRFPATAASMLEIIAAHVAADPQPEITGAVAIRDADPAAYDYAYFMPPILRWLFN